MEPGREGGTWLGLSKAGRLGALLNVSVPLVPRGTQPRGTCTCTYMYIGPTVLAKSLATSHGFSIDHVQTFQFLK